MTEWGIDERAFTVLARWTSWATLELEDGPRREHGKMTVEARRMAQQRAKELSTQKERQQQRPRVQSGEEEAESGSTSASLAAVVADAKENGGVGGEGDEDENENEEEEEHAGVGDAVLEAEQQDQEYQTFLANMSRLQRIELGQMCKVLLDAARAMFIIEACRKQGSKARAQLIRYVDRKVTKENLLLLAQLDSLH